MAAHVKVQANEIAANSGKTVFDNVASYKIAPLLDELDNEDIICKGNLDGIIPDPVPAVYIDFVNPGDNMPKSFSLPARFNDRFGIKFEILLPVSGGACFSDTNGATMTYQTLWVDNTYTTVNRVDIYGAPDDNGKFADKFMFTVYAL